MERLYTVDDCEQMPIEEIHREYREHVNPAQVDLIGSFGFGREAVDHAEGPWIYTRSGRKVLDFTGGIGVLNHGHNHPRILAVREKFQKARRMEVHKNFFSPYMAALSHNIASLLPEDLDYCYFPNSGAEAVEGAVKMAFKYHEGKRTHLLHSDISFHGKLLGAASITASPELDFKFPQIPNCHAFEYNNIESVRALVSKLRDERGTSKIYGLVLEPMSGSSLRECSREFLRELREICDREKIVLIYDEVYTGWAKTGHLFYFMKHGVVPDVLTMAKSLGGGKASISGYVTRKPIFMKAYGNLNDATLHSTTYYGFGEESITALEAVNVIVEEDFVGKAQTIEARLRPGLEALARKYPAFIRDVRGSGALHGLLFNTDYKVLNVASHLIPGKLFNDVRFIQKVITGSVINELYNQHSILTFFGSNREILLIVSPMLVTKPEEIDHFLQALDQTLAQGAGKLVMRFVRDKFSKKAPPVKSTEENVASL